MIAFFGVVFSIFWITDDGPHPATGWQCEGRYSALSSVQCDVIMFRAQGLDERGFVIDGDIIRECLGFGRSAEEGRQCEAALRSAVLWLRR
jgi:hypothetical protein